MSYRNFLFIFLFLLPIAVFADANTGFVNEKPWFEDKEVIAGSNIKVYSSLFNGEGNSASFKVSLLDNKVLVKDAEITLQPEQSKTISFDWKPSTGEHVLFLQIENGTMGGKTFIPSKNSTEKLKVNIRQDIDEKVKDSLANVDISDEINVDLDLGEKKEGFVKWVNENISSLEEFREVKGESIVIKRDEVSEQRGEIKEEGTNKALKTIHLWALIGLTFLFTFKVAFYIAAIIVLILALRIIWRILKRIFRRKYR